MTDTVDLDLLLRDHFASHADTSVPASQVAGILRAASATPQRGARTLVPEWWQERDRRRRRTLVMALLVLGLVVGVAIAGSGILRLPSPLLSTYRGVFEPVGMVPIDSDPVSLTALADGRALVISQWTPDLGRGPDLVLFDPATDTFATAGSLELDRFGSMAVRLADGRVLVVGGEGTQPTTRAGYDPSDRRAEIYDPTAGGVSFTDRPQVPVNAAAGTLLADGRVLITGGAPEGFAVANAQLYDPVSGRFSLTGTMSRPRSNHHTVRLQDGRVLVVGGAGSDGPPGAEIYDPVSGTFGPAGPMVVPQIQGFVLSLLPDGRVLVAGGWVWISDDEDRATDTAQVYDPATNAFTLTGSLPSPRSESAAATLADGRVLVLGGRHTPNGRDPGRSTPLGDAATYDQRSGVFAPTASLTVPRINALAATLVDGTVLVVGHNCLVQDPVCDPPDERRYAVAEVYR